MHSHGASLREVFQLRYGRFDRYVDVVVYPGTHDHVEKLVKLANEHDVVLIPYGGGTNVTQALYLKHQ
jgi:alkyldihydroxyacetonephosphate synthase